MQIPSLQQASLAGPQTGGQVGSLSGSLQCPSLVCTSGMQCATASSTPDAGLVLAQRGAAGQWQAQEGQPLPEVLIQAGMADTPMQHSAELSSLLASSMAHGGPPHDSALQLASHAEMSCCHPAACTPAADSARQAGQAHVLLDLGRASCGSNLKPRSKSCSRDEAPGAASSCKAASRLKDTPHQTALIVKRSSRQVKPSSASMRWMRLPRVIAG